MDSANHVLAAEPLIRLGVFLGVLAGLMAWEYLAPRRALTLGRRRRWPGNVGVVAIDTVLVRIIFPAAAVGLALIAEAEGWGLLNMVAVSEWFAVVIVIVLLDLVIWTQHWLFHRVPLLWRLHRMHHADLDIDVTTGIRFHPVEILLSMVIKLGTVALLGAPALAVMIFEVLLNATSMFNHSNVWMPAGVDRVLRRILVTPDMHRVHHSIVARETHSNFGFNLPWWDHLFGTYRAQPAVGHERMTIGLPEFREPTELRLDRMLLQPLRQGSSGEKAE
ncbi:MAG: sterol desaturase family protein [Pseudomonadota bacterium]|nr:sterol desaturase family protein [Pseudomonadota bacterium]